MIFKGETSSMRYDRLSVPHRHFLWMPMQFDDGEWVFLQYVWRKAIAHSYIMGRGTWEFSYALDKDDL